MEPVGSAGPVGWDLLNISLVLVNSFYPVVDVIYSVVIYLAASSKEAVLEGDIGKLFLSTTDGVSRAGRADGEFPDAAPLTGISRTGALENADGEFPRHGPADGESQAGALRSCLSCRIPTYF